MNSHDTLKFKAALEEWEFELIHRLNYKTFVEELPQHPPNPSRRLIDQFHSENTYFICLKGEELLGMVAIRGIRPFSLEQKMGPLDCYLPEKRNLCEVRLLAIEKRYRHGQIFCGLLELLSKHVKTQGYNLALISANARQEKLYRHLGFVPFATLVGSRSAQFQPMYLTLETFERRAKRFLPADNFVLAEAVSFLPGPVSIHQTVRAAFTQAPVSHRSSSFQSNLQTVRQLLCELVRTRRVEILLGSGTLANDVVAGQLSLEQKPGLILCNGEFGRRLIDHALRWGLSFQTLEATWGEPFDWQSVRDLAARSKIEWLWGVHCETSTGVLNDLQALKTICAEHNVKLCLDCISSIGTTPLDLENVHLASGVSGKGLASFPGLSMVFHSHDVGAAPEHLPRYLDLGFYAASNGVPFTQSSNLLHALEAALRRIQPTRFRRLVEDTAWLRAALREAGLDLLGDEANGAPAVVTIQLRSPLSSKALGEQLQKSGYLLSFGSEYLLQRNWLQICLMGEYSIKTLEDLITELRMRISEACQP